MGDFYLTDVAGEHYFTRDEMFLPGVNPASPPPDGAATYGTEAEAEAERLRQMDRGIHLRVRRR